MAGAYPCSTPLLGLRREWSRRGNLARMKPKLTDDGTWNARHDLIVQIASPEVAAEKLGRTVESVLARRLELGLPDPLSRRERLEKRKDK